MKKKEFPFDKARHLTEEEVKQAHRGIEAKLGTQRKSRGRPPKSTTEKYRPIYIRLNPKVLLWITKEAKRKKMGYQSLINELLLAYWVNKREKQSKKTVSPSKAWN